MTKAANRRWISLQVIGISPDGGGCRVWSVRAATTRKAWASMARGGPAVPGPPAADLVLIQADKALAGLKSLLHRPAPAGDVNQDGQWQRAGREAAVEGQLAGGVVAADHQPALARLAVGRGAVVVQPHKRPAVPAVALGALAARHLLPCTGRDTPEQGVGALGGATDPDAVVASDRQHIADLAALQLRPHPRVGAVDLVPGDPAGRDPGVQGAADHGLRQGRLGRKPDL